MVEHEVKMELEAEFIGEQLQGIREALEKLVEIATKLDLEKTVKKHYFTEEL